jgi:spermidine synthase
VFARDSRYENVSLVKLQNEYSLFLDGFYAATFPDRYTYAGEANFVLLQHPEPRRVLLAGLGATGLIREFLSHPIDQLDHVDFDPELIAWLRPYLPAPDRQALVDDRVRIYSEDIRSYTQRQDPGLYDLIFMNVPDPTTAFLNRLYTREFYGSVARILRDRGVFVTKLSSNENYFGEDLLEYTGSVYAALKSAFPVVEVAPGEQHYFICGFRKDIGTLNPDSLVKRYERRGVSSDYNPYVLFGQLNAERIEFVSSSLESVAQITPNSDVRPSSYFLGLRLWDRYSGGGASWLLTSLSRIRFHHIVLVLCAAILLFAVATRLGTPTERVQDFTVLFSITTTGFSGMAWSMVLLLSFQSLLGYMYETIGILVAAFMFGIACGGIAWRKASVPRRWLITAEVLVVANAALLFVGLRFFVPVFAEHPDAAQSVLFALMLSSGFVTGFEFIPATASFARGRRSLKTASAYVDAFDHLGAGIGSLAITLALIPVLGVALTGLVLVLLNGTSLVFWILIVTRERRDQKG